MLRIPYIFWNICINDIYILQPKFVFNHDNAKLKITNKLGLPFISEVPQRCFFEDIHPRVSWRLKSIVRF